MTTPLQQLSDAGVSLWLDDLSRDRITTGNLRELIETRNIVGVTTNPTIFAGALANGDAYAQQVAALAASGASAETAVFELTTDDVQAACDVFRQVYEATGGRDGRVSIEVEPALAFDAEGTAESAKRLSAKVDRPNTLIKIPATEVGLAAIENTIAAGISVNVTLIFGLERYAAVMDAYLTGLERAQADGIDLSGIHSVASFFVSRVDTEVDKRLTAIGTDQALALKSKAAIANARLAYELWQQTFATERARALIAAGANTQRPLWASTGVKDPSLPDTLYVTELVATDVVNTAPEKTIQATFDHGVITGDTITPNLDDAHEVMARLAAVGIDIDDVTQVLEHEGVDKFVASWNELLDTVGEALRSAPAGATA